MLVSDGFRQSITYPPAAPGCFGFSYEEGKLRKVQWALAVAAAAEGWEVDHSGNLGCLMRVPGAVDAARGRVARGARSRHSVT